MTPIIISPDWIGGLHNEAGFTTPAGISFNFWIQALPFDDFVRSKPIPCSPFTTFVVIIFTPPAVAIVDDGVLLVEADVEFTFGAADATGDIGWFWVCDGLRFVADVVELLLVLLLLVVLLEVLVGGDFGVAVVVDDEEEEEDLLEYDGAACDPVEVNSFGKEEVVAEPSVIRRSEANTLSWESSIR